MIKYYFKCNSPIQFKSLNVNKTRNISKTSTLLFLESDEEIKHFCLFYFQRLKLSGYFLYECIPEQVDYVGWFSKCHLPDTFSSWFYVTELHVWLLMVRCMAEDVALEPSQKEKYVRGDGYFIRNCIVEALWADVGNRIKLLEVRNERHLLL